jgi:hypothetical protein
MKKNTKQYTIRNIPLYVDQVLKQKALTSHKSFNQLVLEIIINSVSEDQKGPIKRNLSFMTESFSKQEIKELEKEIKKQRKIDQDLWK